MDLYSPHPVDQRTQLRQVDWLTQGEAASGMEAGRGRVWPGIARSSHGTTVEVTPTVGWLGRGRSPTDLSRNAAFYDPIVFSKVTLVFLRFRLLNWKTGLSHLLHKVVRKNIISNKKMGSSTRHLETHDVMANFALTSSLEHPSSRGLLVRQCPPCFPECGSLGNVWWESLYG